MRKSIEKYLPQQLQRELTGVKEFDGAEELRIRAGRPAMFYAGGQEYVLRFVPDVQTVRKLLFAFSEHSMTAFFEDLRQGFFTVGKGIRIGVAGRVVSENGGVKMIRDYTSLNIRFPREYKGICKPLVRHLSVNGQVMNTLIISAPQHGKTTLLRDLIRAVSDGDGFLTNKCSVIDERSEISGGMSFDLGMRTDVLLGCPKTEGMNMALRSLSPQVIATDEIGGERELQMLSEASVSGVKILATAHASSREELMQRLFFQKLCKIGLAERIVLLTDVQGRGTVSQIYDGDGCPLLRQPLSVCGRDARD